LSVDASSIVSARSFFSAVLQRLQLAGVGDLYLALARAPLVKRRIDSALKVAAMVDLHQCDPLQTT
jgi:hypothetical protein